MTKTQIIAVGVGGTIVLVGGVYFLKNAQNATLINLSMLGLFLLGSLGTAYAAQHTEDEPDFEPTLTPIPNSAPPVSADISTRSLVEMTDRTKRCLNSLHPAIRQSAIDFISEAIETYPNIGLEVIWGYRTWQEQAAIYAQGRTQPGKIVTNAKPGYSNHNGGFALDIYFKNAYTMKASQANAIYAKIAPIAKKYGFDWGGNWKMKDMPHFEKPLLSMAQVRDRINSGKTFQDSNGLTYATI